LQSEYIAYFDESGDHGMEKIDAEFPVFVLCGCVFKVSDYLTRELPDFSRIKFQHFGHDAVVFHSRDIRKKLGPFQILTDKLKNQVFMDDINTYFTSSTVTLIAAAIDKNKHRIRYTAPANPYSLSLAFCLERIYACLQEREETGKTMFCIFEERGATEDQELALRFEKICSGENQWGKLPFRMVFANKQQNMPGLQVADLAAYPIARHVIDRTRPNPPFMVLRPKFRNKRGRMLGWGLKIFPK
jgi:hypothetical protein